MREEFANRDGEGIVRDMIQAIHDNTAMLSEVDGAIGDGDHGINMNKGFTICKERLAESPGGFSDGLKTLGRVLLSEIGGAMGPLYGTFFLEMSRAAAAHERIDSTVFQGMLERATEGVVSLGNAAVGDKTMVDALAPALDAYRTACGAGGTFAEALAAMAAAADKGRESTRGMAARIGRASRLGERSIGTLDPGATSCALLLGTMARSMQTLLAGTPDAK
jgi:phosphoenolpyruvate---glycerone phosphotransferase subunit DhaL